MLTCGAQLLLFILTAMPAYCDFQQSFRMPTLYAGKVAYFHPEITSGQLACGGMYIYTHQYRIGEYTSPGYMSLGPDLPKSLPIRVPENSVGASACLETSFVCLTCGHKASWCGEGVVKDDN